GRRAAQPAGAWPAARRRTRVRGPRHPGACLRQPHRDPSLRSCDMAGTIFDKIIAREIPADIVYEDEEILAFRDINPQAPVHVLFIPKRPIATLNDLQPGDELLMGKLVMAATA